MKFQGVVIESPELTFTPTGKAVCNMDVDVDGELLPVVTWNEVAEKVSQYVKPEDSVEFYGEKRTRWWTTIAGERLSREEINAHRVKVLVRPLRPDYCCLSCVRWQADCLSGCYSAFGSPADREICEVVDHVCMTGDPFGLLMHRDCWEKQ